MPHSERQIQTGTSIVRAMMQEMNAGRMMSFVTGQHHEIGRCGGGHLYQGDLVWRPWAFVSQRLHVIATGPNCGQQRPV